MNSDKYIAKVGDVVRLNLGNNCSVWSDFFKIENIENLSEYFIKHNGINSDYGIVLYVSNDNSRGEPVHLICPIDWSPKRINKANSLHIMAYGGVEHKNNILCEINVKDLLQTYDNIRKYIDENFILRLPNYD